MGSAHTPSRLCRQLPRVVNLGDFYFKDVFDFILNKIVDFLLKAD